MTDLRARDLLEQIIAWACEHDAQLVKDMLQATDISYQECCDLDVEEYNAWYDPQGDEMVEWKYSLETLEGLKGEFRDPEAYYFFQDKINNLHNGNEEEYNNYEEIMEDINSYLSEGKERDEE